MDISSVFYGWALWCFFFQKWVNTVQTIFYGLFFHFQSTIHICSRTFLKKYYLKKLSIYMSTTINLPSSLFTVICVVFLFFFLIIRELVLFKIYSNILCDKSCFFILNSFHFCKSDRCSLEKIKWKYITYKAEKNAPNHSTPK